MRIQRTKPVDVETERYLLTALIVSDTCCRELKSLYNQRYFQSPMTRTVSKWAIDYFTAYDAPIYGELEKYYSMKAKSGEIDPDLEDKIEKFLESISSDYEELQSFNEEYYIDLGKEYFKKRSYVMLTEQINNHIENNDVSSAEKEYVEFTRIQEQMDTATNVLEEDSVDSLREEYLKGEQAIFRIPGAVGKLIAPIERESLVGMFGMEKSGKTWRLVMFAKMALYQGLNVAFIQTGDLSKQQLDYRLYTAFTKKPARERHAGWQYVPKMDCLLNQMGECEYADEPVVEYDDQKDKHRFTADIKDPDVINGHNVCIECWKDRTRRANFKGSVWWDYQDLRTWSWGEVKNKVNWIKKHFKSKIVTDAFLVDTFSALDLQDWLNTRQQRYGETFDLVLVDYPDIMAPNPSDVNKDPRTQENEKWKTLRRISQEFKNIIIIPTQTDARSYNQESLNVSNFSEDKRKIAHVTHLIANNVTNMEKNLGVGRIANLVMREDGVDTSVEASVLQHISSGQMHIGSFFGKIPKI